MQKTDPMRAQAHAKASAQALNPTLARLKARSLGKAGPAATNARVVADVPEPLRGSSPKPLVR